MAQEVFMTRASPLHLASTAFAFVHPSVAAGTDSPTPTLFVAGT